tara:strand:- start:172 stop:393 length:222 start_codon:yes stop_codon:yes gene_type:complete
MLGISLGLWIIIALLAIITILLFITLSFIADAENYLRSIDQILDRKLAQINLECSELKKDVKEIQRNLKGYKL